MPLTEAQAKIIARIEAKLLDKINDAKTNGGTFLKQVPTVTISGSPVAARISGGAGALGGALGAVAAAVQQAGAIASLVQNPMSLVEGAVGSAVSGVTGKLGALTGQLTGGQLSNITSAISAVSTKLSDFQAHTSNLSGLSSAISDAVPDFKKLQNVGEALKGLGTESTSKFLANTAAALTSGDALNTIKDKLNVTVQNKMDQILRLDANTFSGQTAIATLVTDINSLLNTQANVMGDIVTFDTNNFNETSNNLTATSDVVDLADQYNDPESVTYSMFVDLGIAKESTLNAFDNAITQSTEE
jgi:hypothetical protein